MKAARTLVLLAFALAACDGTVVGPTSSPGSTPPPASTDTPAGRGATTSTAPPSLDEIDGAQATSYARQLAPLLVRRTIAADELDLLERDGGPAIPALVESWTVEPGFAEAARQMISLRLRTSGRTDAIDLDLPGNLAAHLVREDLPYADILRADYCVDATGARSECDTGAPYAAGVLATRAFLTGNEGRFNLKRARTMMRTFACLDYPMPETLQPPLTKEWLLPMFQASTPDEQEDERALAGFGNGFACYTCHSQFGAHAQLFVKFDRDGLHRADATGLQDPEGELGRSVDGLLTSHMIDPARAASEGSLMLGEPVANLADAARVLAGHPVFLECAARTLVGFGFGLADSVIAAIPDEIVGGIVARATAREPEPTLATLAVEVFSDPAVVRSAIAADALAGGTSP